jgi:lipid-A-disaccharide synthase-like uncharacterized protein
VSNLSHALMALLLAAVLAWQLFAGRALGTWWYPNMTRQNHPRAYWFVVAVQGVILVIFLLTGKAWHVR